MSQNIQYLENENLILIVLIVYVGYVTTMMLSSYLVKKIIFNKKIEEDIDKDGEVNESDEKLIQEGFIIGKCENIIILTLVLLDAITALAIVFTAKNIVRKDDITKNSKFYLAGTLINFTSSLVMASLIRIIINLIK